MASYCYNSHHHHYHHHHHHHQPDYRNHLHAVSDPIESSYSRRDKARNHHPYQHHHHNPIRHHQYNPIHTTTTIKREKVGFFLRSGSTVLVPRPSPYRALKSKLIRAGDIELNPGSKQPCEKRGKTCTPKALWCTMCRLLPPQMQRLIEDGSGQIPRDRQLLMPEMPPAKSIPPMHQMRKKLPNRTEWV